MGATKRCKKRRKTIRPKASKKATEISFRNGSIYILVV
jgi:hypothetical protein